jgi:hypothetical protein
VKLQEWRYHGDSNQREADAIHRAAAMGIARVGQVLWCGMAHLQTWWPRKVELSCLVVPQQGEDLAVRVRRITDEASQDPSAREEARQQLCYTARAFVQCFAEAWTAGVFYGDYGLRQVCVRLASAGKRNLEASDLVLVDVEGLGTHADAAKKFKGIWDPVAEELVRRFACIGVSVDRGLLQQALARSMFENGVHAVMAMFDQALNIGGLTAQVPCAAIRERLVSWSEPDAGVGICAVLCGHTAYAYVACIR